MHVMSSEGSGYNMLARQSPFSGPCLFCIVFDRKGRAVRSGAYQLETCMWLHIQNTLGCPWKE